MNSIELAVLNLKEVRRRSIKLWRAIPDEKLSWKPDEQALCMVLFEAYFANIILMCFGIVGGFLLINFQVHNRKKEYKTDTEEKLGIYLRAVANTMGTFSNAFDAVSLTETEASDPALL
jgi:hypothetical protein